MKIGVSPKLKTIIIKNKRIEDSPVYEKNKEKMENGDEDILEEYFFLEAFDEYDSLIAYRYFRIYILLKEEQHHIILFKLKEFTEVLLKFPIIIIANYIWQKEDISIEEKDIIKYIIEKPSALIEWEYLGEKLVNYYKDKASEVGSIVNIIASLCNIYNNYKIDQCLKEGFKKLLNHNIEDEFVFHEIKHILIAIKDHMEEFKEEYKMLKLYAEIYSRRK